MKITYIKHSGFMIEWEHCVWIFDYWEGTVPKFDEDKKVMVFCSHKHADHFNPEIFRIFRDYKKVCYILSKDLCCPVKKQMLDETQLKQITYMRAKEEQTMDDGAEGIITVKTLRSTDAGVAFLAAYREKNIYHAGDLNWWVWKGGTDQEYENMTTKFQREMAALAELCNSIDIAFVPLDPRQEEWYSKGMTYFIEKVGAKMVFPMHFWEKYEVIEQLLNSFKGQDYANKIVSIQCEGQSFEEFSQGQ